jgi:outer membrane protein assembly factor BamB
LVGVFGRASLALFGASVLFMGSDCLQPTEITLSLSTNVPCAQMQGVTIAVGDASEVETMAPQTETQACSSSGNVGTIVVIPAGSKSAEIDVKVVGGVNRDPTTCTAPSYGTGCIVARRSLAFIPHTPLVLDIGLSLACDGVVCPTDETCVQGACTSSLVQNPQDCTQPGTCGQSALEPTNAPPLPPSPLVCGNTAGLQSAAAWPMLGNCPTHIGRTATKSAQTSHVRWSVSAGAGVTSGIAIAADGTIYAGGSNGKLYAFANSGSLKWSTGVGSSSFLNTVPAIAQDGSIYIGNQDANLYSVSAGGTVAWKYAIGGQLFTSANVGGDGTIYVGGAEGNAAYALANDGALKWKLGVSDNVDSSPAIGFDGSIYVGSENSNLYSLSAAGAQEWAFDDKEGGAQTPVIAENGDVFFNGKSSICGVDTQGSLVWATPTTDDATIPAIGWDGTLYAGSADGGFYAFDGTKGTVKWHLTSLGAFDTSNQPIVGGDGVIYIGTTTGVFYAFTPAGSMLWKIETGGAIHGPAAIGSDGTLYFGSDDENIYAIGP